MHNLFNLRMKAHKAIEALCKKKSDRGPLYAWLQKALGIPGKQFHCSMLNEQDCLLVLKLCGKES